MIVIISTPKEAAQYANDFQNQYLDSVTPWLFKASSNDLHQFINYIGVSDINQWHQKARTALEVRLANDAAESANKLIERTKQLIKQTDVHIQHSEKLTRQTDILVTESRRLRKLNWALIILTFGLLFLTAGLLWVDWRRESPPIKTTP